MHLCPTLDAPGYETSGCDKISDKQGLRAGLENNGTPLLIYMVYDVGLPSAAIPMALLFLQLPAGFCSSCPTKLVCQCKLPNPNYSQNLLLLLLNILCNQHQTITTDSGYMHIKHFVLLIIQQLRL